MWKTRRNLLPNTDHAAVCQQQPLVCAAHDNLPNPDQRDSNLAGTTYPHRDHSRESSQRYVPPALINRQRTRIDNREANITTNAD
jgi:hypothetical protein